MPAKVGEPGFERAVADHRQVVLGEAAVHLQGTDGCHQHGGVRHEIGLPALDVEEFLGAEVGAEAGFGHHIVGHVQGGARGDHGVAAMRDIGEGAAMDEGRVVLQRLDEVRLHRILQQHHHGADGLDVGGGDGGAIARVADDDAGEARLEIGGVLGEAEDRHHFGSDRDVEAGFRRRAVAGPAEAGDDIPQATVIHVHHPAPGDTARIDAWFVVPVDVVVDHRGEQVVRRGDGVEVAGEVEVDLVHRHDLGEAAAGGAALHAEAGAERGLAQAEHRLLADPAQRIGKADGGRRLAFAGGGRVDRGDEDQLAEVLRAQVLDVAGRDFRLVMAIGDDVLGRNTEACRHLADGAFLRRARNLDVTSHVRRYSFGASFGVDTLHKTRKSGRNL